MVMDILLVVLSFLCIVIGIIGCLVPILPGASLAYVGMILLHFTQKTRDCQQGIFCFLVENFQDLQLHILPFAAYTVRSVWKGGSALRECSDPYADLDDLIFDEDAGMPSNR